MPPAAPLPPRPIDYHTWRTRAATVAGRSYQLATKPGLMGQGRDDAASQLLAERVMVQPGSTVVCFQCGTGFFGAVAALGGHAGHVHLSDRNAVALEAARRTMAANGIGNATVHAGHGSAPFDSALRADLVAIRIPTEKLALLQLLADAFGLLRVGGQCCIAGATNEGIKSAATVLQALFGNATVLGTESGHRAVMAVKRAPTPVDTAALATAFLPHDAFHPIDVTLRGARVQLFSRPGVFSWEHLDEASAILAEVMEVRDGDDVLDLGCGSGPLGLTAARLSGHGRICMVDVDSEAVRCAARAVSVAGLTTCEVLSSDVASAVSDRRFDVVVTNPPFHVGKGTDLDVPAQFILDAHAVLKPGGSLQLVANRTLPYERLMRELFGNLRVLHDGPRFKVLAATR
ncbi:MAG: methyltransferase [Gemmatimonadota bacterium]